MSLERRGLRLPSDKTFNRVSRDAERAVLQLTNGVEIQGTVYLPSGVRLLDLLNLPAEQFIAVANAQVSSAGGTRSLRFIIVNKAHVVSACQLMDDATD